MNVGEKIKQRREALGWTQRELANTAGMTQNRISEVESGKRQQMSFSRMRDLARALGVSADWLLGTWDDIGQAPEPKGEAAAAPR